MDTGTLGGNTWFSKLDANSAYWQIKLKKEDWDKTTFVTKYGLYEFVRTGFGLCNARSRHLFQGNEFGSQGTNLGYCTCLPAFKEDHIQAVKDWPAPTIQRRLRDSLAWLTIKGSFSRIMLVRWHLFMVSLESMLFVGNLNINRCLPLF